MDAPAKSDPPKRKPGGQVGNTNGARHALGVSGKLPRGLKYVERRLHSFRAEVESAVVTAKGKVDLLDAAAINSEIKWGRHGLLAAHWLRREAATLSPADRLRFSESVAKASDNRDRALRSLRLDRDATHDALQALYRPLPAPEKGDD